MFFSIRQRPPPKGKKMCIYIYTWWWAVGGLEEVGEGRVHSVCHCGYSCQCVCGVPQSCNYFLRNKAERRIERLSECGGVCGVVWAKLKLVACLRLSLFPCQRTKTRTRLVYIYFLNYLYEYIFYVRAHIYIRKTFVFCYSI